MTAGMEVILASVAHERHEVALPRENVPVPQSWHVETEVAASTVENVLRGHMEQLVAADVAEYVPAGQGVHAAEPLA